MPQSDIDRIRSRTNFDVVRHAGSAPALTERAADDTAGDGDLLHGHFSAFNRWYEINSGWEGNFLERIAPGTFEQTFAEDVQRCWFEHGYSTTLDRHSLGSIETLREDDIGAYYEVRLFDGLPEFFTAGLRAGEYGASFRMRILGQEIDEDPGVSEHNERGLPEVTITRVSCPEFGPVSIGASPFATANLRSTDDFYDLMRSRDTEAVERIEHSLIQSDVDPASSGAGDDGEESTASRAAATWLRSLHLKEMTR